MLAARWRSLCPLSLVVAASLLTPAVAQQPHRSAAVPPKVTLDFVVTPGTGSPVDGLTQDDFKVFDNKKPAAITSFRQMGPGTEPMQILVVLDAINAPFTLVSSERDQIIRFLRARQDQLPAPTTLAVVTDTDIYMQPRPSTDPKALSAALEHHRLGLRTLRRSSGFNGASERANLSLHALTQLAARESATPGRKLIFWVSPGWPLLSGPNVQLTPKQERQIFSSVVQITEELRQNQITLYALNAFGATEPLLWSEYYQSFTKPLTRPYDANIGNLALQVFAQQSGGLVLNSNDLGGLMKRALEDTSAYYEITYDKPGAEQQNEFHSVAVQVNQPGLTVRGIDGYYSQP
jgi:VWFA-related protein